MAFSVGPEARGVFETFTAADVRPCRRSKMSLSSTERNADSGWVPACRQGRCIYTLKRVPSRCRCTASYQLYKSDVFGLIKETAPTRQVPPTSHLNFSNSKYWFFSPSSCARWFHCPRSFSPTNLNFQLYRRRSSKMMTFSLSHQHSSPPSFDVAVTHVVSDNLHT